MFSSATISVSSRSLSPSFSLVFSRVPSYLFFSHRTFLSRGFLIVSLQTGLTFTGVYACDLKLHVAEARTITSSRAEKRNKFTCWKCLLSHILLLSFSPSFLPSFSLSSLLSSPYNLCRRAKFIHSPANPVMVYFTYREGGSRANGILGLRHFSRHTIYR